MGHDKLRKFAENETFSCLLQPSAQDLLADGYFHLRDHAVKGHWFSFFSTLPCEAEAAVGSEDRSHPRLRKREGPAAEGGGRGPAQPDVCRPELPCSVASGKEIVLELGCGKGEYTIALAERDPGRNYIGVDIKGARLWKGAKYATEHALPNVAFLRTRVEFITAFFAPGEVSEVWLTFSDPQYRSENSRLSSPLFLERYRSFLKPGGIVHLKTDSRFLYEYTLAVCRANGLCIIAATTDLYGMSAGEAEAAVGSEDRSQQAGLYSNPLHPLLGGLCPSGRLRKREGPAAEGSGRGPAEPDVCRPELPWSDASADIPDEVREVQTFYEKLFLEQGYPITYLSFVIDHEGPFVSPRDPEEFDSKAWRAAEGPRLLFGHDSAETRRQKLHAAED